MKAFEPVFPGGPAPAGPGEAWLAHEIWHRVQVMKLNCVVIAVGPPGSAKSWTGLRVGALVDPRFAIERVIFPGIDYARAIANPDLGIGDFLMWDDAGLGAPSREFWTELNRTVGLMAQSSRFRRLIIWVTLPDRSFLDSQPRKLVNYQLEFIERRRADQPASARVYKVSTSAKSDKIYYEHPRVDWGWGDEALEMINFYQVPPKELTDAYESVKHSYMMGFYRERVAALESGGIRLDDYHSRMLLLISEYARALGKTQKSIAAKLGIRETSLSAALGAARKKLGMKSGEVLDEGLKTEIMAQDAAPTPKVSREA